MYSARDILHPRYLNNLEGVPGGGGSEIPPEGVLSEEVKKKEELETFTRFLLDSVLESKTRGDAEEVLNNAEDRTFYEDLGVDHDTKIKLLRFWIGSSGGIFQENGTRKEKVPLSSIEDIEKLLKVPSERYASMIDFLTNHPLDQHINNVMDIVGSQELKSPREKIEALHKRLDEFKKQQDMGNERVNSHIRVIQLALKIPEFVENNPQLKEEMEKYPNGMKFMRSILIEVGTSKYPISNISLQAEYEKFSGISEDDRYILDQYNPEFLYGSVLTHIKDLAERNMLSREAVQGYINKIRDIIQSRLINQKDSLLWRTYERKFAQMEAIAINPILDDDVFEKSWKQISGKDGIEAFLEESKKGEMLPGAVGKKEGKFHFYPIWEMRKYIMKNGTLDEGIESAWKTYIDVTKGSHDQLKHILQSETNIEAFGIYVKQNPNTNIFEGKEEMKEAFLNELGLSTGSTLDKPSLRNIPISTYPDLERLIRKEPEKYNQLDQIPQDEHGRIDSIALTIQLIKGKNITPEDIKELQRVIIQELTQAASVAKDEADKSRHRLRELIKGEGLSLDVRKKDDENFTWRDVISELGGKTDLVTHVLNQTVKGALTPQGAKILKEYLLGIEISAKNDPRKQEIIKHARNIIELSEKIPELDSNRRALQQTTSENLFSASKDALAAERLANASLTNARTQIYNDIYINSIQKGLESIPQELLNKYHLPYDANSIMEIRNYNSVVGALNQLKSKKERSPDEQNLIMILEEVVGKRQMEVEAYKSIKILEKSHPEFTESIRNIRENTGFLKKMTEQEKVVYEHMATYKDWNTSTLEWKIGQLSPGSTVNLGEYLRNDQSAQGGLTFNLPIQDCTITKTGTNKCSLIFPTDTGIGRVNDIPIVGIRSFLVQAEIYARSSLQDIIPLIPEINTIISKQTGKGTSSFDGNLDVYEMKRTLEAIAKILDIDDVDSSRGIDALSTSVQTRYSSRSGLVSHLRNNGIIRSDGSFSIRQIGEELKKDKSQEKSL